jgi:ElaB/YqjD/DUF883 family membrane-anchored ribosome-binding protein
MSTTDTLNQLCRETEDLLHQLRDQQAPAIVQLRDRLENSLALTRAAAKQRGSADIKVGDIVGSLRDYVSEHPVVALTTGVLIASSVGILATAATRRALTH